MISSSSAHATLERALDSMLIVYSLIDQHPASSVCEEFVRSRGGRFTTPLAFLEVKSVLTKVYGVPPAQSTQKLQVLATSAVGVLPLDSTTVVEALELADRHSIDLTDAVLLRTAQSVGARLVATDDARLARACASLDIDTESPVAGELRSSIAEWEGGHLPEKGLPRVLRRVHAWLTGSDPDLAREFWSATAGGSRLP
jgi:predicted nucleic acid-binding protein